MSSTDAPANATAPSDDLAGGLSDLTLGVGMARRSTPQIVLRQHRVGAQLVGAVGRSSIGFGLAVGRSRSVQPVVRRDDLNSLALRPPDDFWLDPIDETAGWDESRGTAAVPATTAKSAATREPKASAGTSTGRSRSGTVQRRAAAKRPAARAGVTPRTTPRQRRATWTDQVIARSSIGWRSPAVDGVHQPPPPTDFVSTGDSRLDDLRLLLAAREGPSADEATDTPLRAASADSGTSDPIEDGHTAAGPATGPGRLSRRFAPEEAATQHPAVATGPAGGRRSAPAPTRGGGDRLAALREAMAAQTADGPPDGTASSGAALPTDEPSMAGEPSSDVSRSDERTARRRRAIGSSPTPPSGGTGLSGQRRAAADAISRRLRERPARPSQPRSDRPGPAGAPPASTASSGGSAAPPGGGPSHSTPDADTRHDPGTPTSRTDSSAPGSGSGAGSVSGSGLGSDSGSGSVGTITRQRDAALRRATRTTLRDGTALADRVAADPSSLLGDSTLRRAAADSADTISGAGETARTDPQALPIDHAAGQPIAPAVARSTGRDTDTTAATSSATTQAATDRSATTRSTTPQSATTQSATDRSESLAPARVQRRSEQARPRDVDVPVDRPTLPSATRTEVGAGVLADRPIRRVTLPRVLSEQHRPTELARSVRRSASPNSIDSDDPAVATLQRSVAPGTVVIDRNRDDMSAPSGAVLNDTVSNSTVSNSSVSSDTVSNSTVSNSSVSNSSVSNSTVSSDTVSNRSVSNSSVSSDTVSSDTVSNSTVSSDTVSNSAGTSATSSRRASSQPEPPRVIRRTSVVAPTAASPTAAAATAASLTAVAPAAAVSTTATRPNAVAPPAIVASRSDRDASTTSTTPSTVEDRTIEAPSRTAPRSAAASPNRLLRALRRPTEATDVGEQPGRAAPATPPPATIRRSTAASTGPVGVTGQAAISRQGGAPAQALPSEASIAPIAPAITPLGQRFLEQLDVQRRSTAPTRLPASYRPMADAIAGTNRVMLSTDTASRRALRSVGKVAATTDDTIHLDAGRIRREQLDDVMAHELTHVAHPSPAPRFFDDDHDSPEERAAERMAEVIARSPLAPNAPVQRVAAPEQPGAPSSGMSRPPSASASAPASASTRSSSRASQRTADTIRRTPSSTARRSASAAASSAGSISAEALAAQISGETPSGSPAPASAAAPEPHIQRKVAGPGAAAPAAPSAPSASEQAQMQDGEFRRLLERHLHHVMDLVDERIRESHERHGGAWRSF